VFGEERLEGVGMFSIKNCTELGGVAFWFDEKAASRGVRGDLSTVGVSEVQGHVPKCRDVFVWWSGWRDGRGETWLGGVNVGGKVLVREGEVSDRTQTGPVEGRWVRWGEEALEVGGYGGWGEGEK
jgi:hypothetical protein